jgi:hypothetical protein
MQHFLYFLFGQSDAPSRRMFFMEYQRLKICDEISDIMAFLKIDGYFGQEAA